MEARCEVNAPAIIIHNPAVHWTGMMPKQVAEAYSGGAASNFGIGYRRKTKKGPVLLPDLIRLDGLDVNGYRIFDPATRVALGLTPWGDHMIDGAE